MKNWVVLLACLFFSVCSHAQQTIKISTSDWPPYIDRNLESKGFVSQIIKEAFAQVDVKVEFVFLPWARAYDETKRGNFVATSYWYKDKSHSKHFIYSDAITHEKLVFFHFNSLLPNTWNALEDFNKQVIGLTRGYTYTKSIWQYAQRHPDNTYVVGSDEQNFQMMLLGRVDIVPAQEIVGWQYVHTLFPPQDIARVRVMSPAIDTPTGHLLFPKVNKDSKKIRSLFNKGLAKLKESGRLAELQSTVLPSVNQFQHDTH
ncbi:substrate-binding periplasmic protein [Pseudoalteromonas sp. GB56]